MIHKFIFWDFLYLSKIVIILCLPLKYETRSTHLFDETPERAHVASTCGTMKAFLPLTSLLLITHQKFIIYSLHQQTKFYSFISFDTVLLQTEENNPRNRHSDVLWTARQVQPRYSTLYPDSRYFVGSWFLLYFVVTFVPI